ncbi:MAG: proton-conducting transporter membrane subunit, partial [Pseudomonadota bacterium]
GSVIHAMHHEQDMRRMGGLKGKLPATYAMMLIGTLAITGVGLPLVYALHIPIGLAGFISKDVIIEATFAAEGGIAMLAFGLLLVSAALTSFYSWRLIFLTFWGETRADHHTFDHAHESPRVMIWPLYPLAAGAVFAGIEFYQSFVGEHEAAFWGASIFNLVADGEETILEAAHHVPSLVKASPFLAMLLGLFVAYRFYVARPGSADAFAKLNGVLYDLSFNKWYFDELYTAIFVRPAMALGRFLWRRGDGDTIDGAINGLAFVVVPSLVRTAGRMQSGYMFHYAFAMLIGVSLLVTWFAFGGGG